MSFVMGSDFELDRTIMCRAIGKALSDFVAKTGVTHLNVAAVCDEPDVSYDSDGVPHHGVNVRVYLDLGETDDEEDDI